MNDRKVGEIDVTVTGCIRTATITGELMRRTSRTVHKHHMVRQVHNAAFIAISWNAEVEGDACWV